MTTAQKTLVLNYVQADPVLSLINPLTQEGYGVTLLGLLLSAYPVVDFYVWKTMLPRHDILTATSLEGTTFTWTGGAYITRSQGERDAFREMFNSTGAVNPTVPNIRAAFDDIFSGAAGLVNRTHINAISKRKALLIEKILATGTGTLASPASMTYEGILDPSHVVEIMGW